jgi:acylphosphatase
VLVARFFILRGRVQNVGFRFFAEAMARHEGLNGWVRNRPDGAVEIRAEGDLEAVNRFEAKLRMGPSMARVDDVEVLEDVPSGQPGGFGIRA